MAKQPKSKKIYHARSPVASFFKVFGLVILILIIITVVIFFSFQKYIVYTSDGELHLKVPFLSFLYDDEDRAASSAVDIVVDEPDTPSQNDENDENGNLNSDNIVRGISVDSLDPADGILIEQYLSIFEQREINAISIELKGETGELKFYSSSQTVSQLGIAQGPDISATVAQLKEGGVHMIAVISAFEDSTLAIKSPAAALSQRSSGILDPTSETTISYITDMCTELYKMGFDEIVLNNFYIDELSGDEASIGVLTNFAAELDSALEIYDMRLSIKCDDTAWAGDTEILAGFSQIFYRFYADEADHEIASAAAQTVLGEEFSQRFVLINVYSEPEDCGWIGKLEQD